MKKMSMIVFLVFVSIFNVAFLSASCEDVKNEARAVYEVVLNLNTSEEFTIRTQLYNLTENLYVVILNNYNDEVKTLRYSEVVDGVLSFDTYNVNHNISYVVKVYSEDASCGIEPLNTISFTTDKFNEHSISSVCKNPYEIDMCDPFYDVGDMSFSEFNERVSKLVEEASKTFGDKVLDFIKKYYLFVLIPVILIVLVYVVRIMLLRRGKENE